ncbi:MAG: RnfABCDGE type electron transport complex subunit B [Candidatus Marinimicrobia bacterium]|nr:RnfABCDGE type electron transport complex subunit B [Candidatus Neomarinimicrobiota bacterium]
MDINSLLISALTMGGMGLLFSIGLAVASKKFHVEDDPRVSQINEVLPGANCGACGFPGCSAFADNVVKGKAEYSGCPVGGPDVASEVAKILGLNAGDSERMVAQVMCQGGNAETSRKAIYTGIQTCTGASVISKGEKYCEYGCIGLGECVDACQFDAMYMNDNGLPVVIQDKCVGCGECVRVCPQNIMEMHPVSHKVLLRCRNEDPILVARGVCTRACIACGICVREADEGKLTMSNNLAKIEYDKFGNDKKIPTEKCPGECFTSS